MVDKQAVARIRELAKERPDAFCPSWRALWYFSVVDVDEFALDQPALAACYGASVNDRQLRESFAGIRGEFTGSARPGRTPKERMPFATPIAS
jgi:hypothetical protein